MHKCGGCAAVPACPPPAIAVGDGETAWGAGGPGSTKTCGLGSPGRRGGGFCTKFPRQHLPPCSRGRRVPGKTAAELGAAACEEQGWGCVRPTAAAAACVLTPSFCSLPQHRQQHRHVPRSETCTRLAHSLRTRALPPDPHLLGLARTPPGWLSPGGCQTTPGGPPESVPHQTPAASSGPRTRAERERACTHTCSRAGSRAVLIHAQMLPDPAAQRQQLGERCASRWSWAASHGTATVGASGRSMAQARRLCFTAPRQPAAPGERPCSGRGKGARAGAASSPWHRRAKPGAGPSAGPAGHGQPGRSTQGSPQGPGALGYAPCPMGTGCATLPKPRASHGATALLSAPLTAT